MQEIKINIINNINRKEFYKLAENKRTINCWGYKTPKMIKKEKQLKMLEDKLFNFNIKVLKFSKILAVLGLILISIGIISKASANDVLKEKLNRFCKNHELANEYSHGLNDGNNAERCYLIGSAQAYYETRWGEIGAGKLNNIYGFRKNGFMYFEDKTKSIEFYVNRYYKYDRYKTISQIIKGGYYCSPISGKCWYIQGFTHTKHEQENYFNYVKNYFLTHRLGK